jgi:hypothetical protein
MIVLICSTVRDVSGESIIGGGRGRESKIVVAVGADESAGRIIHDEDVFNAC